MLINKLFFFKSAFLLFYRQFRICITNALGKAHTLNVSRIQRLPPGGSSTQSGEGECVTMKLSLTQSHAGSFRHATRATFLPEEGFFVSPIIPQIGRENNLCRPFVPAISPLRTTEKRPSGIFNPGNYCPLSALPVMALMTSRVPIIRRIPMGRQMSQFWIKPAMMKQTKETAAAVMA